MIKGGCSATKTTCCDLLKRFSNCDLRILRLQSIHYFGIRVENDDRFEFGFPVCKSLENNSGDPSTADKT